MIGQPLRRVEDPRLVTGQGRYVDDIAPPGVLHAVFVRSVEAHATIGPITLDEAGIGELYTAADLGLERPMPNQYPSPLITQSIQSPPLAIDEVCYVGQPVAVVVAESAAGAVDCADLVEVDYETLPVIIDHRRALDPGAAPAHLDSETNLVGTLTASFGDVNAAFASAPHRVEVEVDQHRGALASMEGRAVLAGWDDAERRLTLWSSSQAPHAIRAQLAGYLGLSPDELRVIAPDVGGGFGPKAAIYPEEYVVAALAMKLRRPVKWTERRREHFVATNQQRGQSGTVEAAVDREGLILGLRVRLVHDCGAYVPYGIVVPMTTLRLLSGPYVIPALDAAIDVVFTNATPTGAIRGAGRPNATFALERVVDAIARELGLDRAEVRRRNFVRPDQLPYVVDIAASDGRRVTYDSGDYGAALDRALQVADLDGFEERRSRSADAGRLRGFGIASYVEDTGLGPYEGVRIEVLTNGEVLIETGASSQGQGHATVLAQICASHLGVSPDRVRVRSGDTAAYGHGIATVASRSGQTTASAAHVAAGDLAETVKRLAADRLEASSQDIVLVDGVAMVVGQPGTEIPLGDLAAGLQPKLGAALPEGQQRPGLSVERVLPFEGLAYTYGTHVAEVEVDPETGHVVVAGYVVVHDCGTLLNPMIVDGQIDGGVAHGLGNALSEEVRFSEDGQPLTTSFMDYRLITAADMPPLTKIHTQTPSPTNPLGAKGAGEGGTIPTAAAVASAVEHALVGMGIIVDHYPIGSEWVRRAISQASK
ncbi:MAG TPA: xanthine dehydrogenase family protein molybdopterin-binding subunit [Acidimicrobiia bacterium]|nr:xanthine dehydrogenase family protein molybdopterin-binding subunit [Acidimicrobiia bacterium]